MLNYYLLEMTQDIDPEKIREISRKTDFVSAILGIIVLVVFLLLVVYLVYFYKTTKRPTRSTDRFKNYKTVSGKITEVETIKCSDALINVYFSDNLFSVIIIMIRLTRYANPWMKPKIRKMK